MRGTYRLTVAAVALWLSCAATCAAAQSAPPQPLGRWEGTIDVNGNPSLPFSVTFAGTGGQLTGTIDVKRHRASPLDPVTLSGSRIHFELPSGKPAVAIFDGTIANDTISGSFAQGRALGTFTLKRAAASAVPEAAVPEAAVPEAASASYRSEEVSFEHGPVKLAGTLTMPNGKGPFAAVVLVSGSGAQNRDEEIFGFRIFAIIADRLTRDGIAVLRYDDRGVGGSSGDPAATTIETSAGDILEGVALLAKRPEIDPARIGILGHSQGASLAALAATRAPSVAFVVLMAPPAVPGSVVISHQMNDEAQAMGASPENIAAMRTAFEHVVQTLRSNGTQDALGAAVRVLLAAQYEAQPASAKAAIGEKDAFVEKTLPATVKRLQSAAVRDLMAFDPAPVLSRVRRPALALFGGKDVQVALGLNRPALEAAFANGGNAQLTVIVYDNANHLFMEAKTGRPAEYASLPKTFVPGFLDDVSRWISQRR
jgi:pimeloyl-ACP methyl ester carboxylesterase